MNSFKQKRGELELLIRTGLSRFIVHDYVLWDLPYHGNIGDILIWEGERQFLRSFPHKCLYFASQATCCFPSLPEETVILLHGGGNFGDLWREAQEFRLKVIRQYPANRIVIFPQSVYYQNPETLKEDAEVMAQHKKLVICVRDEQSFQILKPYVRNEILLLPDMAFCIDSRKLERFKQSSGNTDLFLKRRDKELQKDVREPEGAEIRDWPSVEKILFMMRWLGLCLKVGNGLRKINLHFPGKVWNRLTDGYASGIVRPILLKMGVKFLSRYNRIYTTRLHVMILSVLLEKECVCLDNSYGKNFAFYETWLKDLPEIERSLDIGK